jgi:hypothetical protein
MERHNPLITKYHHHYSAIYYSHDEASLKASAKSIELTAVKDDPKHPDLPLLRKAYSDKLVELRKKAAQEAAGKAKEEAEEVAAGK